MRALELGIQFIFLLRVADSEPGHDCLSLENRVVLLSSRAFSHCSYSPFLRLGDADRLRFSIDQFSVSCKTLQDSFEFGIESRPSRTEKALPP